MKKSQRMKVVVELAEREEDKLGKVCLQRQQVHAQAMAKLEQLRSYLAEYRQAGLAGNQRIDLNRLQSTRAFLVKLDEAVQMQAREADRLAQVAAEAHQVWMSARQRLQQLEKLVAGYRQEEQALADLREQRQQDEMATQRHVRRLQNESAEAGSST